MAVTNANIGKVMTTLRGAVKNLSDPSVTLVAKRYRNPFHVLISCILSLRTKDETTIPAAKRLFCLADTPRGMLKLKTIDIEKAIYPVGFYRTKARNIKGICRRLMNEYKGRVPDELDVLLTFKGVGRKTANLVLTEGFGKKAICVDTHVHRISNRLGYVKTRTPEETEYALRDRLPRRFWMEYNALLVTWGQNLCRPVSPFCSKCPLFAFCARKGVQQYR